MMWASYTLNIVVLFVFKTFPKQDVWMPYSLGFQLSVKQ